MFFPEVRLGYGSNSGGWNIINNNIPSLKVRVETWAEQSKMMTYELSFYYKQINDYCDLHPSCISIAQFAYLSLHTYEMCFADHRVTGFKQDVRG